jgi:hypothetical protein
MISSQVSIAYSANTRHVITGPLAAPSRGLGLGWHKCGNIAIYLAEGKYSLA